MGPVNTPVRRGYQCAYCALRRPVDKQLAQPITASPSTTLAALKSVRKRRTARSGQNTELALIRPRPSANLPQIRIGAISAYAFNQPARRIPHSITAKAFTDWNMAVVERIAQNIAVHKAVDIQADRMPPCWANAQNSILNRVRVTISPSSCAVWPFAPDDKFCQHDRADRGRHAD